LEYLNARKVALGLFRPTADGTAERVRTDVTLNNFTLKRICKNCNSGWMHRLEERTKPILIGILNGSLTVEALTRDQRNTLARWTGKTAIIESHAIGAESPVPESLLEWMGKNEDDVPGRFGVAVAKTSLHMVGHLQIGMIHQLLGGGGGISVGNLVVLALPNLVLTAAFPVPEFQKLSYRMRCDLSVYKPLWPDAGAWEQVRNVPAYVELKNDEELVKDLAGRIEIFHPMKS